MFPRLIFADPIRVCGQGGAVVEIQFIALLRAEIDPKCANWFSIALENTNNLERFSDKDSGNQLGDEPENYFHA
jgi:hypothetical protein